MATRAQKKAEWQEMLKFLSDLFDAADKDKSSYLDVKEMTYLFNKYLEKQGDSTRITEAQGEILLNKSDKNNDGKCNKKELFIMMRDFATIGENPNRYAGCFEIPGEFEKQEEGPQQKVSKAFVPPTLNMDQETFKKFKKEIEDLNAKENLTDQDYGVIVDKILKYYDKDQSGVLETSEAINFFRGIDGEKGKLREASEFQLNMAIAYIDPNHDGKLERHQLIQFFKNANANAKKRKQGNEKKVEAVSQSKPVKVNQTKQQVNLWQFSPPKTKGVSNDKKGLNSWQYYPKEVQRVKFADKKPQ